MWTAELLALTLATLLTPAFCAHSHSAFPHVSYARAYPIPESRSLHSRNYVTDSTRAASYDFVIAGGGVAGLVLASRLSEDANKTVLVIEAGDTGDAVSSIINTPANTYYDSLVGGTYDWAYTTTAQSNAGGRGLHWPRGKVLGGSSAINGMYIVRPAEVELNAWKSLIASDDSSAAESWGWDKLAAAMSKSETFTPPVDDVKSAAGISYNAASRGSSGPLHVSYPGYMMPVVGNWLPTLAAAGIASTSDSSSGNNVGGFISTSAINPTNWTRSYSKSAYIDTLPPRSNIDILTGAMVSRIVFSNSSSGSDLVATAVEYSTASGAAVSTVKVTKEVILSGGVVGSPQILQLSGIGPQDVLAAAGVSVNVELPGVGSHLQDHLAAGVYWSTTTDTQGTIYNSGSDFSKTAEFLSFINSATAYVNGSYLLGDSFSSFKENIVNALSNSASTIAPSQDAEALAGYKTIYSTIANTVIPNDNVGLIELLLSINAPGQIAVQAAIQHPLSQGRIYINSSSVWDKPVIDPQYFSHSADVTVMREGLKLARRLGQVSPLKDVLGDEVTPGSSVNTDEEWETWLRSTSATEYHPTGTCAMLPKAQGGVVNAKLQVYGTSNVRVVDGSIYPISFSSHLMAPTYGVAEQAAEIIRAAYAAVTSSSSSNSSSTTSTNTGSSTSQTGTKNSGAVRVSSIGSTVLAFASLFLAILLL